MAENTKIEWATHSFSPWIGCSKVHVGCQHCYAEAMAGRLGVKWGPNGTRRRTAESTWKQVEKWNRQAACNCDQDHVGDENPHWASCPKYNGRPRVFPSLCDPFEDWSGPMRDSGGNVMWSNVRGGRCVLLDGVRRDFFALIDRCPNLDFLLLTKRPENVRRMWPERTVNVRYGNSKRGPSHGNPNPFAHTTRIIEHTPCRENCWLLYSASDQASLEAGFDAIASVSDLVPVWGLSLEPLIGKIDLSAVWYTKWKDRMPRWVIVGGESGPRARPMEISWLESIAEQCEAAGVPLFVKQDSGRKPGQQGRIPDRLWARREFPKT